MKHLRKYNESKEELDCKYFDECFIEFIDDGAKTYSTGAKPWQHKRESYEINIKVPKCWFEPGYSLDDNIKSAKELHEFYLDIENCIEKVMIKYPDVECVYSNSQDGHIREVQIMIIN
jgi:hypothetical protein